LTKTLLFAVVVPGAVAVYIPSTLLGRPLDLRPADAIGFIGLVLVAFGICLLCFCLWNFALVGLGTPAPFDPPKRLVMRGPYRWTRNPMYVGMISILVGEAVMERSVVLAEYAVVVLIGFFAFVVLYEEPTLRAKFGAAYDEYRERVPRWIGIRRVRMAARRA
jgi:protein-S-isoprenylcysteine O-methyltransferase Ste14